MSSTKFLYSACRLWVPCRFVQAALRAVYGRLLGVCIPLVVFRSRVGLSKQRSGLFIVVYWAFVFRLPFVGPAWIYPSSAQGCFLFGWVGAFSVFTLLFFIGFMIIMNLFYIK